MSMLSMPSAPKPSASDSSTASVGIVGARGYVGRELASLTLRHPRLRLAFATSDAEAGQPLNSVIPDAPPEARFLSTNDVIGSTVAPDVLVLAMANGGAADFLRAMANIIDDSTLVIDISADHRFDSSWAYGLPESFHDAIASSRRIANPGCYATAMHLALRPLVSMGLQNAHCFGVSGFSGAGAAPNARNNAELLRDNILPYALAGHGHEREASHHLGVSLRFAPAVAPFFRGLIVTAQATLETPSSRDELLEVYSSHYAAHPCVRFLGEATPNIRDVVMMHCADVGAVTVDADDPRRVAVVCAIDNLLKGAASQAIQNINLALGFPPTEGLKP